MTEQQQHLQSAIQQQNTLLNEIQNLQSQIDSKTVSYTHLTLPTIYSV